MNPFDFINAVSHTKENIIEENEKEYTPFIVNKGLSLHLDTIEHANRMNMLHGLDNKLQFDYYINTIRSRKRYSKWFKKKDDDDLNAIMLYCDCNLNKAETILSILSAEQLKIIKEQLSSKE